MFFADKTSDKPKEIGWPVTYDEPQAGGGIKKREFTGNFNILTQAEFGAIYENGGTDVDLCRAVLKGWDKRVVDAEGKEVPFSEKKLEAFIAYPFQRNGVVSAYMKLSAGTAAATKNL